MARVLFVKEMVRSYGYAVLCFSEKPPLVISKKAVPTNLAIRHLVKSYSLLNDGKKANGAKKRKRDDQ
jgi:hypothetical protein